MRPQWALIVNLRHCDGWVRISREIAFKNYRSINQFPMTKRYVSKVGNYAAFEKRMFFDVIPLPTNHSPIPAHAILSVPIGLGSLYIYPASGR
jgi:hypothetical protein